ncbi:MAG: TerB family tellurite resistance protein [Thiohalobacterales bacterium]
MLGTIQAFLDKHLGAAGQAVEGNDEYALQFAAATLLMEVARADSGVSEVERRVVRRVIEEHFSLAPDITHEIIKAAEHEAEHATSLYPLTRLINDECSASDKKQVMRMLWKVTCADGVIDAHEEHLVRRIADLLHVPHRDFIRVKLQVVGEGPAEDG